MNILMTGGCGFIGSHFGELFFEKYPNGKLVNVDKKTSISNTFLKRSFFTEKDYIEFEEDVCNINYWDLYGNTAPEIVIHFAAESHVDNSIKSINPFIYSNIIGSVEVANFCIHNNIPMILVSTDEVYGELGETGTFTESSPINPRNPYSASKASAEFLLKSMHNANPEFKLAITRCSNNFGERQDSTKLIPVVINSLLNNKKIPVYGRGEQVRDWIHAKDHCSAILLLAESMINENIQFVQTYNIGSNNELKNIDLISKICDNMNCDIEKSVKFIEDPRKNAHDFRYSIDSSNFKIAFPDWKLKYTYPFDTSLNSTIRSYI